MPDASNVNIQVRSTDMDADGVVNNAIYFQYFEQARLEHLAMLHISRSDPAEDNSKPGRAFTIAETRCTFRLPLRHRDWITVYCRTSEVGNRSFVFGYEIRLRDEPDTLVAEGSSAQVWLDAHGAPAPLPPLLKESLVQSKSSPPHQ